MRKQLKDVKENLRRKKVEEESRLQRSGRSDLLGVVLTSKLNGLKIVFVSSVEQKSREGR